MGELVPWALLEITMQMLISCHGTSRYFTLRVECLESSKGQFEQNTECLFDCYDMLGVSITTCLPFIHSVLLYQVYADSTGVAIVFDRGVPDVDIISPFTLYLNCSIIKVRFGD
jgi:hypothetical protein